MFGIVYAGWGLPSAFAGYPAGSRECVLGLNGFFVMIFSARRSFRVIVMLN